MGTALAILISKNQEGEVRLWDRNNGIISEIKKTGRNTKYLDPKIEIPKNVFLTSNLQKALEGSDLVLLAIPSFAIREVCQKISSLGLPPVVMISKGLEKKSILLPFQIGKEIFKNKKFKLSANPFSSENIQTPLLHLTWSSFAYEVKGENQRKEVLASENEILAKEFKNIFENNWLKISTSTDLLGTELGSALKNVVVIGISLADRGNPEIKKKVN